jgi:dTDP-4-amino-4,6-dideoxygalactose transaminase
VFVDVGVDGNIDTGLIEAAVTPRTKAILPVYLFGRLCNMTAIEASAEGHGLVVIEDAAQAHLAAASGRRAGSFGTGCFSFYATKNMMAGEGGMVTTDDPALAARLRRLRSHGEATRYSTIELGFNYRMTDIAAAIALAQLARLPELTAQRRANAAYLSRHLEGLVPPPPPADEAAMVWHQYTVRVPQGRDALAAWLAEHGIQTGTFYPTILPDQPFYKEQGYAGDFPVARQLAAEVLSLPVHPALSTSDLEQIVTAVNAWTTSHHQAQGATARG